MKMDILFFPKGIQTEASVYSTVILSPFICTSQIQLDYEGRPSRFTEG